MKESDIDPLVYIEDMFKAANFVKKHTKNLSKEKFSKNELVFQAVIRQFEIIGEASSRVPESFRAKHDQIPWKKIVGLRNKLIHGYMEVNLEIVWGIIQNELEDLQKQLSQILEQD